MINVLLGAYLPIGVRHYKSLKLIVIIDRLVNNSCSIDRNWKRKGPLKNAAKDLPCRRTGPIVFQFASIRVNTVHANIQTYANATTITEGRFATKVQINNFFFFFSTFWSIYTNYIMVFDCPLAFSLSARKIRRILHGKLSVRKRIALRPVRRTL